MKGFSYVLLRGLAKSCKQTTTASSLMAKSFAQMTRACSLCSQRKTMIKRNYCKTAVKETPVLENENTKECNNETAAALHIPVMKTEVLERLNVQPNQVNIDILVL